jgi:hypothetical protein
MSQRPAPEATRLPDVPTRPLRLADGNTWGFALPSRRLIPFVVRTTNSLGQTTDSVSARVESGYPLEIRRLWDDLRSAHETGCPAPHYEAFLALAVSLLRRAHDISPSEARELLSVADEEWPRLVDEILTIVTSTRTETSSPSNGEIE